MDGSHFDTLTRILTTAGSRRRALIALLSGRLSLVGASVEEAAAKNCKRIKNKRKRKKCLAKAKCVPNCAGKSCGDDGCGGSCGDCFRGTCQAGVCICPSGQDFCDGACMPECDPGEVREPGACRCCAATGISCDLDNQCCSGRCGGGSGCRPRNGLEDCTFGAQCNSGVCEAGTCTCNGEICNGLCQGRCGSPEFSRDPRDCGCCASNGFSSFGSACTLCCSGACSSGVCTGLPLCDPCTFDAQCIEGAECQGGRCMSVEDSTFCPD